MNIEHNTARAASNVLTTRGAALLLGVAVSTVQQWVRSGTLTSWHTPGGHRRIPLHAVQQLINAIEQKGSGGAGLAESGGAAVPDEAMPPGGFPVALDEAARARAALATRLFDTPPEHAYNRLVRMASQVTGAPIALVSLMAHDRQWFKARVGTEMTETPRSWAFCNYALLSDDMLYVEDALLDQRFRHNPLVTGAQGIRFYSGCPLHDRGGYRIGTLCVLDTVPRKLSDEQRWALAELALMMSEEIRRE